MADIEKVIAEGQLADTNENTIVPAVAADKHLVISNMIIHNEHTDTVTVTLKFGTGTRILTEEPIPAKKTLDMKSLVSGHIIATGKTIKITASVANVISYYISGILADGGGEV